MLTVVLVCLILVLGIYRFILQPTVLSPLGRIPNAHWGAPFSSVWILWIRFQSRENREIHAAHQRHGPVIRLGPSEISVNSVDGGIRTIYGGGFEKGQWYSVFDNYGFAWLSFIPDWGGFSLIIGSRVPCMFSSLPSRPHAARKRMVSSIYSKSALQESRALRIQSKAILYSRLLPLIDASTVGFEAANGVEVLQIWNAASLDFITAYQFGLAHSTNFLENPKFRQHWLNIYHSRKAHAFFPQELPRFVAVMHSLGIRLVPRWVDAANKELEEWCANMCKVTTAYSLSHESYDDNPYDEPVVLNAVLAGIERDRRTKGSESVLRDTTLKEPELSVASEMIDELAAGHETSGITLTYLTWHLSRDLELQKTLRRELLTLEHPLTYQASVPIEDIVLPDFKTLDKLPILHAILMETLRLNAAIPGIQPRMTPYPSCNLGGYEIPGGTRVNSTAHSLHRNEHAYPSPEKWDYTRWLDVKENEASNESQAKKDRDRYFWAFSSGGRMCIGSNFAINGTCPLCW